MQSSQVWAFPISTRRLRWCGIPGWCGVVSVPVVTGVTHGKERPSRFPGRLNRL